MEGSMKQRNTISRNGLPPRCPNRVGHIGSSGRLSPLVVQLAPWSYHVCNQAVASSSNAAEPNPPPPPPPPQPLHPSMPKNNVSIGMGNIPTNPSPMFEKNSTLVNEPDFYPVSKNSSQVHVSNPISNPFSEFDKNLIPETHFSLLDKSLIPEDPFCLFDKNWISDSLPDPLPQFYNPNPVDVPHPIPVSGDHDNDSKPSDLDEGNASNPLDLEENHDLPNCVDWPETEEEKRRKRIEGNRKAAERSRAKKVQRMTDMLQQSNDLEAQVAVLGTQLTATKKENDSLVMENKMLNQRLIFTTNEDKRLDGEIAARREELQKLWAENQRKSERLNQLKMQIQQQQQMMPVWQEKMVYPNSIQGNFGKNNEEMNMSMNGPGMDEQVNQHVATNQPVAPQYGNSREMDQQFTVNQPAATEYGGDSREMNRVMNGYTINQQFPMNYQAAATGQYGGGSRGMNIVKNELTTNPPPPPPPLATMNPQNIPMNQPGGAIECGDATAGTNPAAGWQEQMVYPNSIQGKYGENTSKQMGWNEMTDSLMNNNQQVDSEMNQPAPMECTNVGAVTDGQDNQQERSPWMAMDWDQHDMVPTDWDQLDMQIPNDLMNQEQVAPAAVEDHGEARAETSDHHNLLVHNEQEQMHWNKPETTQMPNSNLNMIDTTHLDDVDFEAQLERFLSADY